MALHHAMQSRGAPLAGPTAVNKEWLCTFFCPEKYGARKPPAAGSRFPTVAVASGKLEYTLTTDANGNAFLYVFPAAATAAGTQGGQFAIMSVNYPTTQFNPTNGVYVWAGTTQHAGPLNAGNPATAIRLNSFSLVCYPVTSATNSQGSCELAYFQEPVNNTFATSMPAIPQAAMANLPYYQCGGLRTTYSSLHIPSSDDDNIPPAALAGNAGYPEGFYLLVTGAAPLTGVFRVVINYVYDFTPTANLLNICRTDYPCPGPASQLAISNALLHNPGLQGADLSTRLALCQQIQSSASADHDTIVQLLTEKQFNLIRDYTATSGPLQSARSDSLQLPRSDSWAESLDR